MHFHFLKIYLYYLQKSGLLSKTSSTKRGNNKGIGTLIIIAIIVIICPIIRDFYFLVKA